VIAMPTAPSDITVRLLKLRVGGSCVLNVRRPDMYLKTVRKYAPHTEWRIDHLDDGKVVTRIS
jgi:hypothetical protein